MTELLDKEALGHLVPNLKDPWLSLFLNAANAGVARLAPHAVDGTGAGEEAKLIVVRAIQRVFNNKDWLRTESAGPFSVAYATGGKGLFDAGDRTELAALDPSLGGALPSGNFPEPDDYSHLFARPGRRGWGRYVG